MESLGLRAPLFVLQLSKSFFGVGFIPRNSLQSSLISDCQRSAQMPATTQTNGDHPPSAVPLQPRVKQSRPLSPVAPTSEQQQQQEVRPPPPKRARKAINCEPCRNSKLKCDRYVTLRHGTAMPTALAWTIHASLWWPDMSADLHLRRNRPCSSCVLRGTCWSY